MTAVHGETPGAQDQFETIIKQENQEQLRQTKKNQENRESSQFSSKQIPTAKTQVH